MRSNGESSNDMVERVNAPTMSRGDGLDAVWADGSTTTSIANMDDAITSDAWRDDARRSGERRDRLYRGECRENWWTEKRCEEGL